MLSRLSILNQMVSFKHVRHILGYMDVLILLIFGIRPYWFDSIDYVSILFSINT